MIRYENNQIILSGNTEESFSNKLKNPDQEKMMRRNTYIREIRSSLKIETRHGKIILK